MSKFTESDLKALKEQYKLENKFVVIYTGTLGMARDHIIFGRTAELLKDYKDITFLFVGDGEKKKELVEFCEERNLSNCLFIPLQPRDKIPQFLNISGVAINSIRANDCLESSLSNKIFDYLGNGIPVVFSGRGDTAEFLENSKGGIVVEPEDANSMKNAIMKLYEDGNLRKNMGDRGKEYTLKNYSRSVMLKQIDAIIG